MKKYKSTFIIILIFIIDLITKIIVTNNVKLYKSIPVIKNFFNITFTKNKGAAFGMFENQTVLILLVSFLILGYLLYELFKKKNTKIVDMGLSLIIGGLLSNLSDRVFLGYVRDFLDFKIFGYNFAIFNLGDIAIVVGCLIFFIGTFLEGNNENNSK